MTFQQVQKYEAGVNGVSLAKYIRFCNYFGLSDWNFTKEDCEILLKVRKVFEVIGSPLDLLDYFDLKQ